MKFCTGGYIKQGTLEIITSHQMIVFDEQAAKNEECPLCHEKAWHEATAKTLRQTEEQAGKLKATVIELGGAFMLDD